MDPLLYHHSSGGIQLNNTLNYGNIMLNLFIIVVIVLILCGFLCKTRSADQVKN